MLGVDIEMVFTLIERAVVRSLINRSLRWNLSGGLNVRRRSERYAVGLRFPSIAARKLIEAIAKAMVARTKSQETRGRQSV
jgi:hypothetical protein